MAVGFTLSRSGGAAPVQSVLPVISQDGTATIEVWLEEHDDTTITITLAGQTQIADLTGGVATAYFTGIPSGIWDVVVTPAGESDITFPDVVDSIGDCRAWLVGDGTKCLVQFL